MLTTPLTIRPPPTVRTGHVLALRLFDAADRIDLEHAEALWRRYAAGAARRHGLAATPPKAVSFGVPPLTLTLPPYTLMLGGTLAGRAIEATMTARLYDFGAITLALRVPADGLPWADFAALVNEVDTAVGSEAQSGAHNAAPWDAALAALTAALAGALRQPSHALVQEDYLVGVVHALDETSTAEAPAAGPLTAEALIARVDLAALLSGEHRPLSATARADLLRHRFSYYEDDLVVLTWDRAFVYEPRGDADVTDVIEVANAQLLEMRYYDELLDAELPRMNAHVAAARSGLNPLAARRYAGLARQLYSLVADVTELTERVDNALQVTEDVYLARVYAAALDQFRVAAVTAAVNRKLAIIRETYTALYDEAAGARAEVLEIAIVVLIMFEIVMAFVRG